MGRLPVVAMAFVVRVAITLGVGSMVAPENTTLLGTVTKGIGWGYVRATGYLLALVAWWGPGDVGIDRRAEQGTWGLVWFPGLHVAVFFGGAVSASLPTPSA